MPRVVHIVTTSGFAGVERYTCDVASATAGRGWDVTVVGGEPERMTAALGCGVRWAPGATAREGVRSLLRLGRVDITHAHMTIAEALAVATRPVHRAPIVVTRHFAAPRGASRIGRLLAPWIARRVTREIALGEFVASSVERRPQATIEVGVPASPGLWQCSSRIVLVLQRLEPEKDTRTALRAWKASGLAFEGWSMRIVGDGSQRTELERLAVAESIVAVTFAGWSRDVRADFAKAGMLFAPATAEPLGLSVLEAMAAGIPVVASRSGGHVETVGSVDGAPMFQPGDVRAAADALRALIPDRSREEQSVECRRAIAERFTIDRHTERLLAEYATASGATRRSRALAPERSS